MAQQQPHAQAHLAAPSTPSAQGSPGPLPVPVPAGPGGYLAAKRPQGASQPGSPFSAAAFAASPGGPTPPPPSTSPAPPLPGQGQHSASSSVATPVLSLPQAHFSATPSPAISPPLVTTPSAPVLAMPMPMPMPLPMPSPGPSTPQPAPSQYTNATMAPIMAAQTTGSPAPSAAAAGSMGPPLKPADKATKEPDYDVTDSLAGTGIDIRAEEQYLANMFVYEEARYGFPSAPPTHDPNVPGAGLANQVVQPTNGASQKEFTAMVARRAFEEASARLAAARAQELLSPFLNVAVVHSRVERIARTHGLALNTESKAALDGKGAQVRMRNPADAAEPPRVNVSTKVGPDSTIVMTYGSWLPSDVNLADQIALVSLAANQRLRTLVGDANGFARGRQTTSHGEIPDEWQKAAAPPKDQIPAEAAAPSSPRRTSAKRPHNSSTADPSLEPPPKQAKVKGSSNVATNLREVAKTDRNWEERRGKRRSLRKDGAADGAANSRAGSAAPGTPGAADDGGKPEKPPTKKELKRSQSMKTAEAASHANQNATSSIFSSFGRAGSLFGKKGKNKTYDWMNAGKTGATTPSRAIGTGAGAGGAGSAAGGAAKGSFTTEGRVRMGAWREDGPKGEGIQLRDWVAALELDRHEPQALQLAYNKLDGSGPK